MEQEIIKKLDEQNERFDGLMEFLQENMATKEDLKGLATKEDLHLLRQEFEEFRVETDGNFRMIMNELDDIKARLSKLEERTIEDADVAAKDVLELRRRVDMLETQVRQMQAAR